MVHGRREGGDVCTPASTKSESTDEGRMLTTLFMPSNSRVDGEELDSIEEEEARRAHFNFLKREESVKSIIRGGLFKGDDRERERLSQSEA